MSSEPKWLRSPTTNDVAVWVGHNAASRASKKDLAELERIARKLAKQPASSEKRIKCGAVTIVLCDIEVFCQAVEE